jgi:hypothetical protein
MDHAQEDRKHLCLTSTPGHMRTARSEEVAHRLETNVLGDRDIEQIDRLIKHPYAEDKLSIHDIEELQKFLKLHGIRFDFTPVAKGHLDPVSGDLTSKYTKIAQHLAEEATTGVASKTYRLDDRAKRAELEHQLQLQRASGILHGAPDLLTGRTPDQDREYEARKAAEREAIKAQRTAERKAQRDAEKKDAERVADQLRDERGRTQPTTTATQTRYEMRDRSMTPPRYGGSRKIRRTRRHKLKKRISKHSGRNRKSRKRAHTRRRR